MPSVPVRTLGAFALVSALTVLPAGTAQAGGDRTRAVPCHDNAALIAAVQEANAAGSGTISLAKGCTYRLSRVFPGNYGDNALPGITGRITVEGNGAVLARAGSAPDMRIVEVAGGGSLTLKDVTLRNGRLSPGFSFGGNAFVGAPSARLELVRSEVTRGFARWGGGILNDGPLTVRSSRITHNSTSSGGGGIWNRWTLNMTGSRVAGNAGTEVGGIVTGGSTPAPTATATVRRSTVAGNRGTGVGVDVNMTTHLIDSVVTRNRGDEALAGGGVYNEGSTTLTGTRVSRNHSASDGGGIFNKKSLLLRKSAVVENVAERSGGGIFNAPPGEVSLWRSVVKGNRPDNCVPPSACSGRPKPDRPAESQPAEPQRPGKLGHAGQPRPSEHFKQG
ncbi:right-handed parallel beta-helix repeat-containing protein [Streptomyces sp. WMMB 322]|uniref:right-handed parallel beta-helix repeat-containing protein n=1 Tax=Streptomyces sp. WMMB 322 TaxID=1286821 RepID=UPI0006E169FD|nr:right-handed parallel beta-helix repeat-containing protein [Streptomyces sp. WMMB 322]SCK55801.1 Right handed beta helix region [Streptomyces sp. WMMB 322]